MRTDAVLPPLPPLLLPPPLLFDVAEVEPSPRTTSWKHSMKCGSDFFTTSFLRRCDFTSAFSSPSIPSVSNNTAWSSILRHVSCTLVERSDSGETMNMALIAPTPPSRLCRAASSATSTPNLAFSHPKMPLVLPSLAKLSTMLLCSLRAHVRSKLLRGAWSKSLFFVGVTVPLLLPPPPPPPPLAAAVAARELRSSSMTSAGVADADWSKTRGQLPLKKSPKKGNTTSTTTFSKSSSSSLMRCISKLTFCSLYSKRR
mmetsp:Transcript_50181/g.100954  ORF Transcript_50181/g.100954 Transcript_50181/m.100954 type:complete len:257 (+) Transcript_50181:96-866(+)